MPNGKTLKDVTRTALAGDEEVSEAQKTARLKWLYGLLGEGGGGGRAAASPLSYYKMLAGEEEDAWERLLKYYAFLNTEEGRYMSQQQEARQRAQLAQNWVLSVAEMSGWMPEYMFGPYPGAEMEGMPEHFDPLALIGGIAGGLERGAPPFQAPPPPPGPFKYPPVGAFMPQPVAGPTLEERKAGLLPRLETARDIMNLLFGTPAEDQTDLPIKDFPFYEPGLPTVLPGTWR